MIASVVGDEALDARIGESVAVDFEADGAGNTLPVFRRS
jgi:hypothetical protein